MLVKVSKIIFNQTKERRHVVTTIELCYIFLHYLYSALLFERPAYSEAWGTLEEQARLKFLPASHSFSLSHSYVYVWPVNALASCSPRTCCPRLAAAMHFGSKHASVASCCCVVSFEHFAALPLPNAWSEEGVIFHDKKNECFVTL